MSKEPEYQPLSREKRLSERRALEIQLRMNRNKYMRWNTLLKQVDPDRRYRVDCPNTRYAAWGRELLEKAHRSVMKKSCTMVQRVRVVKSNYVLPVGDLWDTFTDPETGRTMVTGHQDDVWDLTKFLEAPTWPGAPEDESLARTGAHAVTILLLMALSDEDPELAGEVSPVVESAAFQAVAWLAARGENWKKELGEAVTMATGARDRACGRARMLAAGVDIDEHPEWRSYQKFFEMNMAPPTHEEMADHMIRHFGTEGAG